MRVGFIILFKDRPVWLRAPHVRSDSSINSRSRLCVHALEFQGPYKPVDLFSPLEDLYLFTSRRRVFKLCLKCATELYPLAHGGEKEFKF